MEDDTETQESVRLYLRLLHPRRPVVNIREPALTIQTLWKWYLKKWQPAALVPLFWLAWFGGLTLFPYYSDYNDAADARARVVQAFDMSALPGDAQVVARKKFSNELLTTYSRGVHTDIELGSDTAKRRSEILAQLKKTKETGQKVVLDTTHDSAWNHPGDLVLRYGSFILAILSFGLSFRYVFRTLVKVEYVADLPWRRGWPVVFAALMPILWPVFIASAIRLAYAKRLDKAKDEVTAAPYQFKDNKDAARKFYFDARLGGWINYVSDKLAVIEKRLAELTVLARARQQERNDLLADRRELKGFNTQTDAPDSAQVRSEFESILADPRVLGLTAVNGYLFVHTSARFEYEGKLYDLGDWVIIVSTAGLTAEEVRKGTKVDWHVYAHPIYRLSEKTFCFGAATATINKHLQHGEIGRAILLAVECLNTINQNDLALVPKAFKEIDAVPET